MRIQDIMTNRVETSSPGESAEVAWERMRRGGFHHLVVMEEGRIKGVISARDLGGRHGAASRAAHTVSELMTEPVVTARRDMPLRQAANLMRGRSIGCLVVVKKGGKLAGIMTASDLLEQVGRGSIRPTAESVRWTLRGRGPRHRRVEVEH